MGDKMTKNKIIKTLTIVILVFILLSILYVNIGIGTSDPFKDPGDWKPTIEDDKEFVQKAGKVYEIISVVGIIIAAIALAGIGIKYMLGSVEEKAEYKKSMLPYIIGIILLGLATSLPRVINMLTEDVFKGIVG